MSEPFDPYYTWLGIPPHEQPANLYRLLGISPLEPNAEVISNAADRVMLHLRAFQAGQHSRESQQLLNEVASARLTLLDPASKSAYDAELRADQTAAPPPVSSPPNSPPEAPLAAPSAAVLVHLNVERPAAALIRSRAAVRPSGRRRKPTPTILIVALVAAALVAIGGGLAFWLSRASGLHSESSVRPVQHGDRPQEVKDQGPGFRSGPKRERAAGTRLPAAPD